MSAVGSNREYLIALPRNEHSFALRVANAHFTVSELCEWDSLAKVWAADFRLFCAHKICSGIWLGT